MYREFNDVYMYNVLNTKVEIMMAISEDKLEVYPKQPYSSRKFWKRQKSFSNNMDGIVECDITDKFDKGKRIFK